MIRNLARVKGILVAGVVALTSGATLVHAQANVVSDASEILKLRADLEKKQGAAFSLQAFHDAFMRQGGVPIKIVREAMLGDFSPTL